MLIAIIIVMALAIVGLLAFVEFLWVQIVGLNQRISSLLQKNSFIIDEGWHEGESWGEAESPTKRLCNPGDTLFVNIHTGDAFLRVYSVRVLECRDTQVVLETIVWNEEDDNTQAVSAKS